MSDVYNHPEIFVTNDYSAFKFLKGNRDIKQVKRIVDSVREIGQFQSPILVNEKMEIIDGQHRFAAFSSLGLPIYYQIHQGVGLKETTFLNSSQRRWSSKDFLHSQIALGNENYIYIDALQKKYHGFAVQVIVSIFHGNISSGGGRHSNEFQQGGFVAPLDRRRDVERTLETLIELDQVIKSIGGQRRMTETAIAWCLNYEKTDRARLIDCIKERHALIRPAADVSALLRDISNVYNKGIKKASKRIYFDVAYKEKQLNKNRREEE